MSYPGLGRLIDRMVKSLNARSDSTMAGTMTELADRLGVTDAAIHKWRQGKHKPAPEILAQLIKIGVAEAGLDRAWAERMLFLGEHPEREALLNQLFGELAPGVRHNLPRRPFLRLVGREKEVGLILERLASESRHWLIPIEGIGGVGKSALALELGWRLVEGYQQTSPGRRFEAVIWVSAKREVLTMSGVEIQPQLFTNLDDVYRAIAEVLAWPGILRVPDERRSGEVGRALRSSRVLLFLDNLETVDDPQVLRFLRDLPPPTKAIATMRFHEDMPYPIRLSKLDEEAARELALQECEARSITLDDVAMNRLLTYTRGIPLAIWWAIGLLAMEGYTIKATLDRLANPTSDLQRFIFGEVLVRLRVRWPEALEVLLALTFFDLDDGATTEALAATTDLALPAVEQAQQRLLNLNLISRHQSGGRFTMLPLTRDFAQQELSPEWEAAARERWSVFYFQYVELYGDEDLGETVIQREKLRDEIKNIRLVIEWCFVTIPKKAVRLVERISAFLGSEGEGVERVTLLSRALEVAQQSGMYTSPVSLLIGVAWSYLNREDYQRAQEALEQGLKIAQKHGLQKRLVQFLRDLGWLYFLQGNYSRACELCMESLELAEKIRQEFGILLARAFLARMVYYKSGHYPEAEQTFLELLPKVKKSYPSMLYILRWLGEMALAEGKLDKARSYLEEMAIALKSYYDADTDARLHQNWGDLEKATGHLDKAREAYEKGLYLSTRLGMRKEVERLEQKLQELEQLLAQSTSEV
jgi:tetratricopeptide (TPR) repeat protein/transcriptional regulator with XRE-family HTH domain